MLILITKYHNQHNILIMLAVVLITILLTVLRVSTSGLEPSPSYFNHRIDRDVILKNLVRPSGLLPKREETQPTAANDIGLPNAVISLFKLWKIADEQLLIVLLSPEYLSTSSQQTEGSQPIKFGVLQEEWSDILLNFIPTFDNWSIRKTAHHLLFSHKLVKCNFVITKIYSRKNYFYTKRYDFGDYHDSARAFLKFGLVMALQLNDVIITKPDARDHYLWQYEYSTFLPCDPVLSKAYIDAHPDFMEAHHRVNEDNFQAMLFYRDSAYRLKMPIMLFSGNLLGWYRHCDFIPHAHDIDFALNDRFYNQQFEADLACDDQFEIKHVLGKLEHSYEIGIIYRTSQLVFDLFLLYTSGHQSRINILDFYGHRNTSHIYPRISEICTTEIRENLFFVPCNAEDIIGVEFGFNWMNPIIDYNYMKHPQNLIRSSRFNALEYNRTFPVQHPTCKDYKKMNDRT